VDKALRVYRIFAAAFKPRQSVFMLLLKRCFQSVIVIGPITVAARSKA
jgi:hypothetical protein